MKNLLFCFCLLWFSVSCKDSSNEVIMKDKNHIGVTSAEDLETNIVLSYATWEGTYQGVLPCADCPGIETELTLTANQEYTLKTFYQGNPGSEFTEQGTFEWVAESDNIRLNNEEGTQFKIGDQHVVYLNMEGQVNEGNLAEFYILKMKK